LYFDENWYILFTFAELNFYGYEKNLSQFFY
jgi:hypothetical protein